jgi:hypothetical protein
MMCIVKLTECEHAVTRYRSPTGLWEGPVDNGYCLFHQKYFSAVSCCVIRHQLRGQAHIGDFGEVSG